MFLFPASTFAQNILLTADPTPNNGNALAFTLTSRNSSKSNGEIPFETLKNQFIASAVNYRYEQKACPSDISRHHFPTFGKWPETHSTMQSGAVRYL